MKGKSSEPDPDYEGDGKNCLWTLQNSIILFLISCSLCCLCLSQTKKV